MTSAADLTLRMRAADGMFELAAKLGTQRLGTWRRPLADVLGPARDARALLDTPQARVAPLRAALRELGQALMTPLAAAIDQAAGITVQLPPQWLELPIELLPHRGQPLGLRRPVEVQAGPCPVRPAATAADPSAYFVSDHETDPDRACLAVARRFARFTVHEARDTTPRAIARLAPHDVVVCSLHGQVRPGPDDHLWMAGGRLRPAHLAGLRPRLVYLDACRLGLSPGWLDVLRAAGTLDLIAPIANNEGGRSSTATMTGFFDQWLGGEPPARALWRTRRGLWEACRADDGWHRLWRSCVFRAYRLG